MERRQLRQVPIGKTFMAGGQEFIKFTDDMNGCAVVARYVFGTKRFGNTNNFAASELKDYLNGEFLETFENTIGLSNILTHNVDLISLDGLDDYGVYHGVKVSVPTYDFYRKHIRVFDNYQVTHYWWLATPKTTTAHRDTSQVCEVHYDGYVAFLGYHADDGIRPFMVLKPTMMVNYNADQRYNTYSY